MHEEAEKQKQENAAKALKKEDIKTITNGKNEKECSLTLCPNYLVFRCVANLPAFSHFTIKNETKVKHAFKIKTNSRKLFMARPSVGYLEPGEENHIKVTYLNSKEGSKPKDTLHVALFHKQIDGMTASKEAKRDEQIREFKDAYKNSPHQERVHHFFCNRIMDSITEGGEDQ